MAEELAQCHPFSGNATVPCDNGGGYMLRGPCARARQCGNAKGDYPDPQEQTASSDRRRECQDYRRGSSAASPSSDARTLFPPLNVILPQWSQHNGCFHTLRGRHLGVFKNKGKKETRTIKTAKEKTSTTNPLCPFSMPGATWASVAAEVYTCVDIYIFVCTHVIYTHIHTQRDVCLCAWVRHI
uniref:Uncharacterized protein n=1 Tax=Anser cygnoides TaxID=8845 RepID=A0A8B9EJI7_ANSCY